MTIQSYSTSYHDGVIIDDLDGKIASVDGDSKLSSYEDTKRVHKVRAKHDAILIGWRTAVLDDPILTVRYTKGKNPVRIIIDSRGTLPLSLRVIKTAHTIPTIVAVSSKISKLRRMKLESFGVNVIVMLQEKIALLHFFKIYCIQ